MELRPDVYLLFWIQYMTVLILLLQYSQREIIQIYCDRGEESIGKGKSVLSNIQEKFM